MGFALQFKFFLKKECDARAKRVFYVVFVLITLLKKLLKVKDICAALTTKLPI
jgi:hypothetical protein